VDAAVPNWLAARIRRWAADIGMPTAATGPLPAVVVEAYTAEQRRRADRDWRQRAARLRAAGVPDEVARWLLDRTPWDTRTMAAQLGVSENDVSRLRVRTGGRIGLRSRPHPTLVPDYDQALTVEAGRAREWALQRGSHILNTGTGTLTRLPRPPRRARTVPPLPDTPRAQPRVYDRTAPPAHDPARLQRERQARFTARQARWRALPGVDPKLVGWLLDRTIWSETDAANQLGVSPQTITYMYTGRRKPGQTRPHPARFPHLDVVIGHVVNVEQPGFEAGRVREWAVQNGGHVVDRRTGRLIKLPPWHGGVKGVPYPRNRDEQLKS